MNDTPSRARSQADPADLLHLHDKLDRLTPARGPGARIREAVVVVAAGWASWMILGTAADLGVVWPAAVVLGVGWAGSIGITVARRKRIHDLRRRIRTAEGRAEPGGAGSG